MRGKFDAIWHHIKACDDLWIRLAELKNIVSGEDRKHEAQLLLEVIADKKQALEAAYNELNSDEILRII